jgi:uncharacterized MAPEG superfamily protein
MIVPDGFAWVLFFTIVTCFQLTLTGFGAMGARKKYFTKDFFEKNFPAELKNGEIDTRYGYPDVGSGQYSMKLPHAAWRDINNAQRGHLNFLETALPVVIFSLVAGLSYTRLTVLLQIAYTVGRFFYASLYKAKGPEGRLIGVLILDLALVALFITSALSAWSLGGGFDGLKTLIVGK